MIKYGIVENNDDSTHPDGYKLGRCQVRVIGKHTFNRIDDTEFNYLPTENLPWFELELSPTFACQQRNFEMPIIENGSTVTIEYFDEDEQHGLIRGVVARIPTDIPNFENGFTDPDKKFPISDDINKSPFYPYGTGETNAIIQNKISNVASSALGFTEPATKYAPKYTKNKVFSTKNHFIELDETEGKERIHIYHKSGTFIETHPNGDLVINTKNSKYQITTSDDNTKVSGDYKLDVSGEINILSGNSTTVTAGSSEMVLLPNGNITIGNSTASIGILSTGAVEIIAPGGISTVSGGASIGINSGNINIVSDRLTHNGTNIGDDHTHGGVLAGGASTDVPN